MYWSGASTRAASIPARMAAICCRGALDLWASCESLTMRWNTSARLALWVAKPAPRGVQSNRVCHPRRHLLPFFRNENPTDIRTADGCGVLPGPFPSGQARPCDAIDCGWQAISGALGRVGQYGAFQPRLHAAYLSHTGQAGSPEYGADGRGVGVDGAARGQVRLPPGGRGHRSRQPERSQALLALFWQLKQRGVEFRAGVGEGRL